MSYVIVDASVSLKWALNDGEHVAQAVALRDAAVRERRFEMLAPSLWVYEIANGLIVAARRGCIDVATGEQALRLLLALGVRLVDPAPVETYRETERFGITAYDAAYLALARALDAPLWTGDRRFYQAVQGDPLVRWIGEFV